MTIVVTPIIYWPINIYINDDSYLNLTEYFPVLFATIFGSLILSLPTFIFLNLILEKMISLKYSHSKIKLIISLVGLFGVQLTLFILDSSLFSSISGLTLLIVYSLFIIVSSIVFKIESSVENSNYG
jgi:hypothetical protein